jgi:hypothetical protein
MIPAIALAFIPAIITFLWVWANQLQQAKLENAPLCCVTWASTALLPISQRIGQIIMLVIFLAGSSAMLIS